MRGAPKAARIATLAALATLAACNPPPSDEALMREMPEPELSFASEPLPPPETSGAVWATSERGERIVFGIPGEAVLLALECVRERQEESAGDSGTGTTSDLLRITRFASADDGAGALMALIGNGHMERLPVDAALIAGRLAWQGTHDADAGLWEPLTGPRQVTATVPGAGKLTLGGSALPMALIRECRTG